MNASIFPYRNEFHLPGTIKDQKPNMTNDLVQDIDKISHFNVMMKKFHESVLSQVGMSSYLLHLGVVLTFLSMVQVFFFYKYCSP